MASSREEWFRERNRNRNDINRNNRFERPIDEKTICPHCAWIRFDNSYMPRNKGLTLYNPKSLYFTCENEEGRAHASIFISSKFPYTWSVIYGTKQHPIHNTRDIAGMIKCIHFIIRKLQEEKGYQNLNVLINSHVKNNQKEHLHAFISIDKDSDADKKIFREEPHNTQILGKGLIDHPYDEDEFFTIDSEESINEFLKNANEFLENREISMSQSFYIFMHYRGEKIEIIISTGEKKQR